MEVEVGQRFFYNYIEYLESKGIDLEEFPSSLLDKDKDGNLHMKDEFTLGNTAFILGTKCSSEETKEKDQNFILEYCQNVLFAGQTIDIRKKINNFGAKIQSYTDKYRNPSAHTSIMEKEKAMKCIEFIIDKEYIKDLVESTAKKTV